MRKEGIQGCKWVSKLLEGSLFSQTMHGSGEPYVHKFNQACAQADKIKQCGQLFLVEQTYIEPVVEVFGQRLQCCSTLNQW